MKINRVLLLVLLVSISCKREGSLEVKDGTVFNNITIISANDKKVDNLLGYVVIDNDKIVYADSLKPRLSGNYKEINGEGKFIISGLMDSHVHLANTAGFNGRLKNKYQELLGAYFEQLPRSYLYHGFTTLVDVNNYAPQLIEEIKNSPLHPDIYTCGNQVQVMDDFMMEMEEYAPETRFQFQFLHDTYNTDIVFPDSIDLAEHTPEKIVAEIRAQDGVGVKLAYEDEASGLKVSWAKPSREIISDLVLESQRQNIPVLLHAPSLEGHQVGLEAGVEIFAHGL